MLGADVVVVGAGVVGLSAALRLAERGLEVAIVDRGEPGSGASGLNGGMVQHSEAASGGLDAILERGGAEMYRWLAIERGHDIGYRASGCLVLIRTEEELALARSDGAAVGGELLDAQQLAELEPVACPGLLGAIRHPDAAQADPMAATLAMADETGRAGVAFHRGAEVEAIVASGDVWSVEFGDETLRADRVVVAAGAWMSALVPQIEVVPILGQMWETAPTAHRLGHTIAAMESTLAWTRSDGGMRLTHPDGDRRVTRHVYGRQRSDGTIAFGGDRVPHLHSSAIAVDDAGIEVNHDHVQELLPGLGALPIARTWAGLMPFTRDGMPVLGAMPDRPGLWIAGGLASNGFGRGPGAGRLVADLVAGDAAPVDLAAASPARFGSAELA